MHHPISDMLKLNTDSPLSFWMGGLSASIKSDRCWIFGGDMLTDDSSVPNPPIRQELDICNQLDVGMGTAWNPSNVVPSNWI